MSRSRKKPYITQQNRGKPKRGIDKRTANRAVRATPLEEVASGKGYRKISNSWDIRDWSIHDPKNKKSYRK